MHIHTGDARGKWAKTLSQGANDPAGGWREGAREKAIHRWQRSHHNLHCIFTLISCEEVEEEEEEEEEEERLEREREIERARESGRERRALLGTTR